MLNVVFAHQVDRPLYLGQLLALSPVLQWCFLIDTSFGTWGDLLQSWVGCPRQLKSLRLWRRSSPGVTCQHRHRNDLMGARFPREQGHREYGLHLSITSNDWDRKDWGVSIPSYTGTNLSSQSDFRYHQKHAAVVPAILSCSHQCAASCARASRSSVKVLAFSFPPFLPEDISVSTGAIRAADQESIQPGRAPSNNSRWGLEAVEMQAKTQKPGQFRLPLCITSLHQICCCFLWYRYTER